MASSGGFGHGQHQRLYTSIANHATITIPLVIQPLEEYFRKWSTLISTLKETSQTNLDESSLSRVVCGMLSTDSYNH